MKSKIINCIISAFCVIGIILIIGIVGEMDYTVITGTSYEITDATKIFILGLMMIIPAIVRGVL